MHESYEQFIHAIKEPLETEITQLKEQLNELKKYASEAQEMGAKNERAKIKKLLSKRIGSIIVDLLEFDPEQMKTDHNISMAKLDQSMKEFEDSIRPVHNFTWAVEQVKQGKAVRSKRFSGAFGEHCLYIENLDEYYVLIGNENKFSRSYPLTDLGLSQDEQNEAIWEVVSCDPIISSTGDPSND